MFFWMNNLKGLSVGKTKFVQVQHFPGKIFGMLIGRHFPQFPDRPRDRI